MSEPLLICCIACGAINRVPSDKLRQGLEKVCGRCKTALPANGKPVDVTDVTFSDEVESSRLPVLLDMSAPWCGPCRFLSPMVEDLAAELAAGFE
jgi:thioredoxin 2